MIDKNISLNVLLWYMCGGFFERLFDLEVNGNNGLPFRYTNAREFARYENLVRGI